MQPTSENDTGPRLRREVEANIDPNGPAFAKEMLAEVVELYPAGSNIIKGYVTITFASESSATGKKRSALEMGRDVAARLPGLTGSLSATGAGAVRPMDGGRAVRGGAHGVQPEHGPRR